MKKKVLFIDRDGTIIVEPPETEQVDSIELLQFIPGAIVGLHRIAKELDFELVMVTNQDGLGTNDFPEDTFWLAHNMMMATLEGEGVSFNEVFIDRSKPEDKSPNRKPGTGMLTSYFSGEYDLEQSFVIGDRSTDVELAENLGCKSIFFSTDPHSEATLVSNDWKAIFNYLRGQTSRTASVHRKTNETDVSIQINLDRSGKSEINTGIGFFDHMLDQLAKHGDLTLQVNVVGDLHIDSHHTIEDTALALGQAFYEALGDKKGISRYGFLLPMDDCLAQVAIDFGGRPWLEWDAKFEREKVGEMPTEMFFHFFKSFTDSAKCNLNVKAEGDNEHHKIEAIFKAFARAIRMAKEVSGSDLPSTKGSI